jgi:hypothetical protein
MVMAPTIMCKHSMSEASEQGKSLPQDTDQSNFIYEELTGTRRRAVTYFQ